MNIIEQELNVIKEYLENCVSTPFLEENLTTFLTKGAKFIRSSLAILYLKSQGKVIDENIYKILVAGELIHSASLLHDDVIDEADIRRGEITIANKFCPTVSILAGDYLLSFAIEKILDLKKFEIIESFKDCTKKMTLAELKQFFLRGTLPTENEYIEICQGKTAELFSTILKSVAFVAGLDDVNAKNFGQIFGIVFQIKNDLEKDSALIDKKNSINTAIDILGIEKTKILLDNYKEEMSKLIRDFPNDIYKKGLKDLFESL